MTRKEEVKIIVVGEHGVGKSSIVARFITGQFEDLVPTIGAAFLSKDYEVNGRQYLLHIWDTAGQEKYRYLVPMYYRGSKIAIVVYDVTDESSYNTIPSWLDDIKKSIGEDVIVVLCGNKCDLDHRTILVSDATQQAREWSVPYVETSARTGVGIQKLFEQAVSEYEAKGKKSDVEMAKTIANGDGKQCC